MKLGTRNATSISPGTGSETRVAILYSQPTVAPTLILVFLPLTVANWNLGNLPISANNEPSTLYQDVPPLCTYVEPLKISVASIQSAVGLTTALCASAFTEIVSLVVTPT